METSAVYSYPGISITEEYIQNTVLHFFPSVNRIHLSSKSRKREYVLCRAILVCIDRIRNNKGLSALMLPFKKDHATAIHYFRLVSNLYDTDKGFRCMLDNILNSCMITKERFELFQKSIGKYWETRDN